MKKFCHQYLDYPGSFHIPLLLKIQIYHLKFALKNKTKAERKATH